MTSCLHSMALAIVLGAAPLPSPKPGAPPPAELMDRLAKSQTRVETFYAAGEYSVITHYGHMDPTTHAETSADEMVTWMTTRDGKPWEELARDVEGGVDVTKKNDAARAREMKKGRVHADGMPFRVPFTEALQPLHRYEVLGPDPADPRLLRIGFTALQSAAGTADGEAVVDPVAGTLVRLKMKPRKRPLFCDWLELTMEFGLDTPQGSAMKSLVVDATGGIFFYRQRVHVDTHLESGLHSK
jgi:hypothetical protein